MKKLYRSRQNRIIAGVCGGIAEYLDVDPTVVRLIYLFLGLTSLVVGAVVFYIVAALIIPQ
ncbi:MAG: PspC domain-containing protein [Bacillota bacterium]|jgi:phage shock protein C|nr:PspC domain-containing protein [Bacillota bacterium]NLU54131.1 PspC domain-containing protein [Bacillota bacterium]HOA90434.1 PspC domain-containing protein [Bacillota bacterium]HOJ46603.1 PspC domain-containing protein [Bacillota bacterium]HOL13234.1 PspC domain-containing protein [Bacillota bacterium]